MAHDVFPPEPVRRRRSPAGQALVVALVALLLGSLLNADRLDHTARTQPFGWQRTWAMRITGPLKSVSHLTRLNLPRQAITRWADNEDPPPLNPEDQRPVTTAPPLTPGTPVPGDPSVPEPDAEIERRVPTAEDPVRVLVAGDSLMGLVAPAIHDRLGHRPIDIEEDWAVGTGLARPDVRNWPAVLAEDMAAMDPEVVVLGFGGNDNQDMASTEGRVTVGTPEWQAEYQQRVARVLNAVEGEGRTVYWVGLPPTDRPDIEAAAPAMETAVRAELAVRPWAHYVDTRPILAPDGVYTAYLDDGSGSQVKVRADDGVHPNLAGAIRMVEPLVEAVRVERRLDEEPPPVPPSTTSSTAPEPGGG